MTRARFAEAEFLRRVHCSLPHTHRATGKGGREFFFVWLTDCFIVNFICYFSSGTP